MTLQAGYDGFHLVLRSGNETVCLVLGNEEFAEELAQRWNIVEIMKTTPQIPKPPITREEICENYVVKALEARNDN